MKKEANYQNLIRIIQNCWMLLKLDYIKNELKNWDNKGTIVKSTELFGANE